MTSNKLGLMDQAFLLEDMRRITNQHMNNITSPYNGTIPSMNSQNSPRDLRVDRLRELSEASRILDMLKQRNNYSDGKTIERLELVINELMDELYPNSKLTEFDWSVYNASIAVKVEPVVAKPEEVKTTIRDVTADIEKAAGETEIKCISYLKAEGMLMAHPGKRVARKGWDNALNQEFVVWTFGIGFVKHYKTASADGYFKNVEHTYKPTKEDLEATDWYIV